MKKPELTVLHSETIAAELAFNELALIPSGDNLLALNDRLGLKTPGASTVALVYPGDQVLFSDADEAEDPDKADVASVGMQDLTIFPEGALPVTIGELSEQNILESLARSLVTQAQFNQRMRVLKWGGAAAFVEMGIGATVSTMQGPGFNSGLLGIPAAGATIGGLWLWHRGWRNKPLVMPSLDELESPIMLVRQTRNTN